MNKLTMLIIIVTSSVILWPGCGGKPATDPTPVLSEASEMSAANASSDAEPTHIPKIPTDTDWLQTKGNKIFYTNGDVFRGRGANIHDTRSCNACTWFEPNVNEVKRRIDELTDNWGANFMRLCLESYPTRHSEHQQHWQTFMTDKVYMQHIIEIVEHIGTKPGVYVLVSLWSEPTFDKMGWPTSETNTVWETLAKRLLPYPHVLFGVNNEPQSNGNGARDAEVWQRMNAAVSTIREVEKANGSPQHIIVVQGTRSWARHLGYYIEHPITAGGGTNIAYETHSYLTVNEFQENWIAASTTLPVIIGEFAPSSEGDHVYMSDGDALTMMDEAEKRDIPWLAWTFHMRCGPSLLKDNSGEGCGEDMPLEPSPWGEVIKARLKSPWKTE